MEKMQNKKTVAGMHWLLLLAGMACNIFLSPKWTFPLAAWIGPACFLLYIHFTTGRKKWFWLFAALLVSQTEVSFDVIPMPLPILLIIVMVNSLITLMVYRIYDWITKKTNRFISTLVFPAMYVAWEYWGSNGGGGVWGAMANTQFTFSYLAQLASVTGIWGISFLVYWWNAVFVWCLKKYQLNEIFKKPLSVYASIFLIVMIYGIGRYHFAGEAINTKKIKAAGIALSQFESMEGLYEEVTGNKIKIDPAISQSSPQLQKFNKAFITVLENPDTLKYKKSFAASRQFNDSLFALTKAAADKGAQLVLWAEANAIIYPWMEAGLVAKGKEVSQQKNIYLLMAYAVLTPGKIIPGKKFMENKTVFMGPDGKVLNTFYKNKPVPYAESSVAGDGKIPVINTALGKASVSICYDADFPELMKQLGKNKPDFLLLPSGDWFAISPHHTYMALYRGIENGCPIIRDVKGGLSVAADYRGKIYSGSDFYNKENKQWIFELPVGHVKTIYSAVGDWVAYSSIIIMAVALLYLIAGLIKRKFFQKSKSMPVKVPAY
jgi:apolipoprotein N-acyltransferase